ncbi:MAG TPA: CBS domain-containing protein [Thermoplasmatales archaeon]|nr:CBS domain-containing protein [Thermoplasmatales archaeon]
MKKDRLIKEFYNLKVKDLMDHRYWDLPVVEKDTDIATVLSILSGKNHVWVVDNKKNRRLVGVITEHDTLSLLSPPHLPPYMFGKPDLKSLQFGVVSKAEDIMSEKPITCKADERIYDVLLRMKKYRIRRIAVVDDDGKLIGEITLHHLICKYYKASQYYSITEADTDKKK